MDKIIEEIIEEIEQLKLTEAHKVQECRTKGDYDDVKTHRGAYKAYKKVLSIIERELKKV